MEGNMKLDLQTAFNLRKVSPSVVSVVLSIGDKIKCYGSGTLIKTDCDDNSNIATILTSASVIPDLENSGAETKVMVYLSDGKETTAKLVGRDVHYNLALIEITVNQTLPAAKFRWLDDTVFIDECSYKEIKSSMETQNIFPGDRIIALSRSHVGTYFAAAAPGSYIMESPKFDCQELLYTTCVINESWIGGPVVNCNMEVIGVTFYSGGYASFLPINVAMKWWEAIKLNRKLCHPSLGIGVGSLLLGNLESVQDLVHKFPEASKGLVVLKVVPSSAAWASGILEGDIIIKCDGKVLSSSLEFFEAVWERAEATVELVIVKVNHDSPLHVKLAVEDVAVEKFNSWPVDEVKPRAIWMVLEDFFCN